MAMAKKKANQSKQIVNRRAKFDYALGDEFVAGIALTGAETKALRRGHGQLQGAYVVVKDGELWLLNAKIMGDNAIKISEEDQVRSRKLLVKRRELEQLANAKQNGQSIIPTGILTKGRYIKVRIATGRGKKKYDKREVIKKREQERNARQMV